MRKVIKQAEASKAEATSNITVKINVLNEWVTHGIPLRLHDDGSALIDEKDKKQLDYYPRSLRQFKAWDGTQNCKLVREKLPAFSTTGNDTLPKRPELQEKVRCIIEALRLRASQQETLTHPSEIKRLQEELKIAKLTIKIRNAELRNQQRALRQAEDSKIRLEAKVSGDKAEFERLYKEMAGEIQALKNENI